LPLAEAELDYAAMKSPPVALTEGTIIPLPFFELVTANEEAVKTELSNHDENQVI